MGTVADERNARTKPFLVRLRCLAGRNDGEMEMKVN